MTAVTLPGLPAAFRWDREPAAFRLEGDALRIEAGPQTDLFVDPQGAPARLDAPRLLGRLDGDLQLSARVSVGFASTFDAGVLLLYAGEPAWAKLCFELSPDGRPMVVSVVTRGLSDDANAFAVEAEEIWLRISRIGAASAFHASHDSRRWELIRHFALGADAELGFLAQSPTGEGCSVTFDQITFVQDRLADLRSGV